MSDSRNNYHYVSALDDILTPPPAPLPEAASVASGIRADTAWLVLLSANILVTIIIIAAMLIDGSTTRAAIAYGVIYFAPTTTIFVLALTGTLTDIVRSGQREKTERQRIDAYTTLAEKALDWRLAVESNRQLELQRPAQLEMRRTHLSADPVQTPTFVPPYDNRPKGAFAAEVQPIDTTAEEALGFARGLYLDSGKPNPNRVWLTEKPESHGRLRGNMVGSKRGEGSNEARLWLLHRRIIVKKPGGYALNLTLFPTRDDLRWVR